MSENWRPMTDEEWKAGEPERRARALEMIRALTRQERQALLDAMENGATVGGIPINPWLIEQLKGANDDDN